MTTADGLFISKFSWLGFNADGTVKKCKAHPLFSDLK